MKGDTKIKYVFHNEYSESIDLTFTIVEIEGMKGGFMNHVLNMLEEIGFGKPVEVYRILMM